MKRRGRRAGVSGTRAAIVAAAGHHFARHGYDRASLRRIAADAGVDQRLIAHFFGSKQQLFVAAVGLPLNPVDVLHRVVAGDPDGLGERLTEFLTEVMEKPEIHERMTGILRAAASEPEVARMMREFLGREVLGPAAQILGSPDAPVRMSLVGSQFAGLVMARYVIGVEPLVSMPPRALAAAIAPSLERYLRGALPPGES